MQADQATCFQIFKQQDDYIIHAELQVTKLDKDGHKKWEFGGADIFVSIDNEVEFRVENDTSNQLLYELLLLFVTNAP